MTTQPQRAQLRDFIVEHFSREELFTFCSDYFRDFYQDNEGSSITKSALARDLVEYCEQRDSMASLQANLQRVREKTYLAQFEHVVVAEVKTQPRNRQQVFLSHAHEDVDFAKRLAQDLREAGLSVWMTPDSIQPSEQWASAIERGLDESKIFLVLLTPNSVKSRWVRKETLYALQHDHIFDIAPVIVKACDVAQLSKFLTQIQHFSFESDYERGLEALCQRLGVQSAAMKAASHAVEAQRQRETAERGRDRLAAEQMQKQREAEELAQLRAENERLTKALDERKSQQIADDLREKLRQDNERLRRDMAIGSASQAPVKIATADEIAIPMGNGIDML